MHTLSCSNGYNQKAERVYLLFEAKGLMVISKAEFHSESKYLFLIKTHSPSFSQI